MHVPGAPERTGRRLSPRGPEEQSARVGGSLSAPCCFGDGAERGRPDRPISHDACITTRCRTKHSRRWSGDWSLGYESWRGRQMACGWTAGLAAHLDRFLPPSPAQGVFRVCGTTSHERGRLAEARASGPETPTGLHVRHRGPTLDIASAIKERAAQRPELSELVRNVTPLAGLADSLFPVLDCSSRSKPRRVNQLTRGRGSQGQRGASVSPTVTGERRRGSALRGPAGRFRRAARCRSGRSRRR